MSGKVFNNFSKRFSRLVIDPAVSFKLKKRKIKNKMYEAWRGDAPSLLLFRFKLLHARFSVQLKVIIYRV